MLKLTIISPGKIKEAWLQLALKEYEKRLTGKVQFTWIHPKDDQELAKCLPKNYLCLDPMGTMMDSPTFSTFLHEQWVKQGSTLTMVIGGPDGLPEEIKKGGKLVSYSKMTFTHQLIRLILVEQIYRAIEIKRGSPYHK